MNRRERVMRELAGRVRYVRRTGAVTWKEQAGPIPAGTEIGTTDSQGHRQIRYQGIHIAVHRLIWLIVTDICLPPSVQVDHRDTVRDNNRWKNLRLATNQRNCFNQKKIKRGTTSAFKGVTRHGNGWVARIGVGKPIYIGWFTGEVAAAKAYDTAARKHHGKFARLNFPRRAKK